MAAYNPPTSAGVPSAFEPGQLPKLKADLAKAKQKISALDLENKALKQQVLELARFDQLTGFINRKSFLEKLNEEFLRAGRYHHRLGLAVIDPDHLKQINDEYGQKKGDAVLKIIAATTREVARDGDSLARISGQVIAVILPYASMQNCQSFAERLRRRIIALTTHPTYGTQLPCPVTVSIGAASTEAGIGSQEMLFQQAENMALLSKTKGGNIATIYEFSPSNEQS